MRERFHARDPRSWRLRFHTQTAGVTLTAQQPDNNVIRTTVQALAAVLGGTQSLHVNSRDEASASRPRSRPRYPSAPSRFSPTRAASPTPSTPWPASYYVESLTDRLEEAAFDYIAEIDRQGGAVEALEAGYQTDEIHESAFKLQREIEEDDRIVVGVNKFTTETPPIQQFQRIDPEAVRKQIARVQRVRHERDEAETAAALQRLQAVASVPITPCPPSSNA